MGHAISTQDAKPLMILLVSLLLHSSVFAAPLSRGPTNNVPSQLVLIDTDVGDDIDDAFAIGLALSSPELKILGITTAWGDTSLRVRLLDRLLTRTGHTDIPVAVGIEKHHLGEGTFSQARWADLQPSRPHPPAVDFLLQQISVHPGQITLIGLAPFTNLAAAFDRDPETFRKLKRIVIMGGSVYRGYGDLGYLPDRGPGPEYNIAMDPAAARKVFTAGVPLYVLPLDSTQLPLDESMRQLLFAHGSALTDALALLYHQWAHTTHSQTPTLFDAVAVAYAVDPDTCPVTPMRLIVDDAGYTRTEPGHPNTFVCLNANPTGFFKLLLRRLLDTSDKGKPAH